MHSNLEKTAIDAQRSKLFSTMTIHNEILRQSNAFQKLMKTTYTKRGRELNRSIDLAVK